MDAGGQWKNRLFMVEATGAIPFLAPNAESILEFWRLGKLLFKQPSSLNISNWNEKQKGKNPAEGFFLKFWSGLGS